MRGGELASWWWKMDASGKKTCCPLLVAGGSWIGAVKHLTAVHLRSTVQLRYKGKTHARSKLCAGDESERCQDLPTTPVGVG